MKTILLKLSLLIYLLSTFLLVSTATFADVNSGANCRAANLSQALNLGMGTNQFGVINNGNAPFFVVCPDSNSFSVADENTMINEFGIGLTFPDGGGSYSCIFRGQLFNDNTFRFESFTGNTTSTYTQQNGTINPVFSLSVYGNITVVCALGPGQGVRWYYTREA